MDIIDCIKNFDTNNCLPNKNYKDIFFWLLSIILQIGILSFFIKFLVNAIEIPKIVFKILKNNRFGKGRGYGTLAADQFVELWHSDKNYNDIITEGSFYGHGERTQLLGNIAEQNLIPFKLVGIYDEYITNTKKIKAIKNQRNKIIYFLTKIGCLLKYNDSYKYYKTLKK